MSFRAEAPAGLSWIAAIITVPVAVVGWFVSGTQKTSKAAAGKGGTAIAGDMDVKTASIVAGHNSSVNVSLAISNDTQNADRYERRYAVFQAVGKALDEALCNKMLMYGPPILSGSPPYYPPPLRSADMGRRH